MMPDKVKSARVCYNGGPALRVSGLLAVLAAIPAGPARAQGSWILPSDVPSFELPLASPRTSAIVGRIISVTRADSRFGPEWEAEPALGEILPFIVFSRGSLPIVMHLGAEVYGRYSLADQSSAHISSDWHVNLITTAELRRWRFALEAYHESSHLGDEYRDRFNLPRQNWSRGIVGLWIGYVTGGLELRANGSYAALDRLQLSRGALLLAADYRGRSRRLAGAPVQAILAVQADAQAYTDWRPTYSGRAGFRFAETRGARGFALLFTFLSGQSTQRQFFYRTSRYVGFELRFDL